MALTAFEMREVVELLLLGVAEERVGEGPLGHSLRWMRKQ